MTDLSQSSTSVDDPLHAYADLPWFPRTLLSIPRLYQSDDRYQTHTLLDSMPFEIGKEHQEQAKEILGDSCELLKEGIGTTTVASQVGEEMKLIMNKRERRPGLDRKRGHFSFKPTTSQPPQNEPTFDASKYPNPDEFFAAFERHEIAKREWQKQTGTVVTDAHQNQPSKRPHRPGLPGRKRGSYKHTYTDNNLTDATNLEASENEIPIPSEQSLEKTTTAEVMTADRDVDDSAVDTDKNIQNIFTEFLACDPDELVGDIGVKRVEERLQLKAIDVGMLSLPEFQEVRKSDLKVSGRNPSKRKNVLSDIQNLIKRIHSDGARKSSQSPSPSPNPPGDQFSFPDSDHLLPGVLQSSKVDVAKDLSTFSGSPVTNDPDKAINNASPSNVETVYVASPVKNSVQMASSDDDSDLNIISRSPVTNNPDKVMTNASPSTMETAYVASPLKSSVQKTSSDNDSDTHSGISRFNSRPDGNADNCVDDLITNRNSATVEVNVDTQTKGKEEDVPMNESEVNENTDRREKDVDINEERDQLQRLAQHASREAARMDPSILEEDSILCQQDASSPSLNRDPEQHNTVDGTFEHVEHSEGKHGEGNDNTDTACGVEVENAQEEVHSSSHKQSNKPKKRRALYGNVNKRSKTVHDESEGEKQMKTSSSHGSRAKNQNKTKSNEREAKKQMKTETRESKAFSRRKSLGGAGTKWESGVRRSTRIKSRPLEYWRGERFLFGRIHQSLATVIGVKYESPGKVKSDKPEWKVKSFVSDEYKELIDIAALH